MKDFDGARAERSARDEEERTFKLGGETFTIRPAVRPETLIAASRVKTDSEIADDVAAFDEMLEGFLEPVDRDRYRELRLREDDPVTFADLMDVAQWAVEVNTGRPTGQPSLSSPGLKPTGTELTAVPPLTEETQTA